MSNMIKAIAALRPGVDFANLNGTLAGIRWDNPPPGFVPPTQEEVDAAIARADVPAEVWAGAMMRALNALGLLAQVDQIVAASNDLLMQKLWARAAAFRRDDPMIAAVGASVDPPWSESDLDDLFRLAGSLD